MCCVVCLLEISAGEKMMGLDCRWRAHLDHRSVLEKESREWEGGATNTIPCLSEVVRTVDK